mmetsp:Transcript_10635/g.18737  ORF Transcript_10635/g.18737 Transcript_10635/m.18737 type:complete len:133 (+) Transcript_10635:169-567(+)|eukprot:CAMPEP_0201884874 /NCGR_PEP_ID=MMETSP0902-20130614/17601_1 /ASSEMBLY_ACC=CAM_ASM_000551 /TAXON_ID=420261 /ORGANISM="Thalassiosira antarctica, Strain CCMP982" /LENGTH=132 /DNA_ID=CAMNT_0048413889 /DNA_START=140 /DNA_END=538 /DNA_ORIENTATION=+
MTSTEIGPTTYPPLLNPPIDWDQLDGSASIQSHPIRGGKIAPIPPAVQGRGCRSKRLGPKTPTEQREHQRRAKQIIEMDRLASSVENHGYETGILRIRHHDPVVNGQGGLLFGAKQGSIAADVFSELPIDVR